MTDGGAQPAEVASSEGLACIFPPEAGLMPERHERRDSQLIRQVLLAETLDHPALFNPYFAPQCSPGDEDREYTAPFTASDGRTGECKQQPRVGGMAHKGVGTAGD